MKDVQYDDEATTRVNKLRASTKRKEQSATKVMTNAELKRNKKVKVPVFVKTVR